jgi:SpoVK/Ycf46/Vps4 family AAA+-type ATPase
MKKEKGNNKKQNALDLPVASAIKIQLTDDVDEETKKSLIFKLYIKNFLFNKALRINKNFDFILFQKNKNFKIINSNVENKENDFLINEDTIIEIITEDNLESQFNKLKITENVISDNFDKDMLQNLLENNLKFKIEQNFVESGLEEYIEQVEKFIKLSLHKLNSNIPSLLKFRGVNINGPIGVGKSHLLKTIISKHSNSLSFLNFDIPGILMNSNTKREDYLKNIFKFAKLMKPSVIIAEDIDKIFHISDEGGDSKKGVQTQYIIENEKTKLLLTFINEMDILEQDDRVIVISTTTNYDILESDLKKDGRLDYVVTIAPPKQNQRKLLLQNIAKLFNNIELSDEDFEILADKSHGFVAGDLVQMFKNAVIRIDNNKLNRQDLELVLKDIKPISLKDIILDIPKVLWDDIGGNKEIIRKIRQSIEWPLKHPESFKKIGISPPNVNTSF